MKVLTYLLIRAVTFPMIFLSYRAVHNFGIFLGHLAYHLFPKQRKRALSNLALATSLNLSNKQIIRIAKASLGHIFITILEYPKLAREKNLSRLVTCTNPEIAQNFIDQGQGIIFFCAHQANWELLFLEGTQRMPGTAIGRPFNNPYLYRWILSIRERFNGKMITPKQAAFEGLKALKKGRFLGIVGDQAMPQQGFEHPFLGRNAWTSPLPALLSHRSGAPLFFATTHREKGHYTITYSDPIFPTIPPQEMMTRVLSLLESTIKKAPEQWLWIHNRWKQQLPGKLKKPFRHDSIGLILPSHSAHELLSLFRTLYPRELITIFTKAPINIKDAETAPLHPLPKDYRHKLIFNLTNDPYITAHFRSLAATTYDLNDLKQLANIDSDNLSLILNRAVLY